MTPRNRITAFLKNTEILAGQVLEERNPGSLVCSFNQISIDEACMRQCHWPNILTVSGTLLDQPTLYEDDVNNPESLQRWHRSATQRSLLLLLLEDLLHFPSVSCRTLETENQRKLYIAHPIPAENSPLVYPETDQPWIGRRIDYILYRESSVSKYCRTVSVNCSSSL